jgi:hypothetical protein
MFDRTAHKWLESGEWAWEHLEETAKSEFQKLEIQRSEYAELKDCGIKALAASCSLPYIEAKFLLERFGRLPKNPTEIFKTLVPAVESLGLKIEPLKNAKGRTVRTFAECNPRGRFVVVTKEHGLGVVNGRVIDWTEKRLFRILYVFQVTLPPWFEALEQKVKAAGFKLSLSSLPGLVSVWMQADKAGKEEKVFEGCPEALSDWLEKDYAQLAAESGLIVQGEEEILQGWFAEFCPIVKKSF